MTVSPMASSRRMASIKQSLRLPLALYPSTNLAPQSWLVMALSVPLFRIQSSLSFRSCEKNHLLMICCAWSESCSDVSVDNQNNSSWAFNTAVGDVFPIAQRIDDGASFLCMRHPLEEDKRWRHGSGVYC